MSDCLISRRGGAGIPPSVAYPIVAILTQSGTWTVPESGTYRISCIGSGGTAAGYMQEGPGGEHNWFTNGGGGGIAESTLKLAKDSNIAITLDAGVSSFGAYLSATAGSDGVATFTYTTERVTLQSGTGGAGNGGNIGNYTGSNLGSTDSAAKYGGASRSRVLMSVANPLSSVYRYIVLSENQRTSIKDLYGGGQGTGEFEQAVPSDTGEAFEVTPKLNGAVIIEQIK
mgnify:CR=1 FL=1|jgi:hypothetical protein